MPADDEPNAIPGADEARSLPEKLDSLLESHRRFVTEFQHSLDNARHFIRLAGRSLEQEPENTVEMLDQIREIDLLGHVQRLFEEFRSVRSFLAASPVEEAVETYDAELDELAEQYEFLEAEAESQLEDIDRLLGRLES